MLSPDDVELDRAANAADFCVALLIFDLYSEK
jgi:hypothetical protein